MKAAIQASSGGAKTKRRTKKTNIKARTKTKVDKPDYGRRIVQALRQISQCMDMNSRYLHVFAQTTMPQLACLEELLSNGNLTISALAKKLYLSSGAIVGIIDRLEEKDMVKRVRSATDRRAVFVEITRKGSEFVKDNPHILHNRLKKTLDKYSDAEQILMANAVEMVLGVLRESNARVNPVDWDLSF